MGQCSSHSPGPSHSSLQTTPSTSWECSHLKIPGAKFRPSNCGGSTGGFSHSHSGERALTVPILGSGVGEQDQQDSNYTNSHVLQVSVVPETPVGKGSDGTKWGRSWVWEPVHRIECSEGRRGDLRLEREIGLIVFSPTAPA